MKTAISQASPLLLAFIVAGCGSLPSVGPDYEEPAVGHVEYALPDAGQPTTNLTATCEYRPADTNEDVRVVVSADDLYRWWKRFDDPVLESLVEGGISNNVSFLMAQSRLERAAWELLGSYAGFLPQFGVDGGWHRYWYHPNTRSGGGSARTPPQTPVDSYI